MAEADDDFLVLDAAADVGLCLVGRGVALLDLEGDLVGSAVLGAFESADGSGDAGVEVGAGAGDDAGSEGGGVELVLGVEDERGVHGADPLGGGGMAVEEMEEVGADAVVLCFNGDAAAVACEVVPVEEDGAERGKEAVGDEEGGGCGVGLGFGLDGGEHGDADVEDVHGVRGAGDLLEGDFDGLGKAAQAAQALLVVGELGGGGEMAVEQEVGDLFELAVGGELMDVVAAVVEIVAGSADGAEGGVAGGDAGEGYGFFGLEGGGFGHGSPWSLRR